MPNRIIIFLIIALNVISISNNCFAQRRHLKVHNGWKDTTGTADLQSSRQEFWDSLPDPTGLTTDFENIFTNQERAKLDSIILDYEKRTSIEFCIVTLDTMHINKDRFGELPAYIEKSWGIGKTGKDNGVVICLSIGYKAIRIASGSGLEDYLTERETSSIIEKQILPAFKKKKYFQGTVDGLYAIMETLDKKIKGRTSAIR